MTEHATFDSSPLIASTASGEMCRRKIWGVLPSFGQSTSNGHMYVGSSPRHTSRPPTGNMGICAYLVLAWQWSERNGGLRGPSKEVPLQVK